MHFKKGWISLEDDPCKGRLATDLMRRPSLVFAKSSERAVEE
jgi:hypothetical protein